MTKKTVKRVRKPSDFIFDSCRWGLGIDDVFNQIGIFIQRNVELKTAKEIHKWLGSAIAYLEQEAKK